MFGKLAGMVDRFLKTIPPDRERHHQSYYGFDFLPLLAGPEPYPKQQRCQFGHDQPQSGQIDSLTRLRYPSAVAFLAQRRKAINGVQLSVHCR